MEAVRNEIAVQRVANLVLNASALADRMQARRGTDLDGQEHRARVAVLRDAASAGREAIRRATAELVGREEAEATGKTGDRQDSSA